MLTESCHPERSEGSAALATASEAVSLPRWQRVLRCIFFGLNDPVSRYLKRILKNGFGAEPTLVSVQRRTQEKY